MVIPGIECIGGKKLIDMIHGQDHNGEVRCALRENKVVSSRICDGFRGHFLFDANFKNLQVISQRVVPLSSIPETLVHRLLSAYQDPHRSSESPFDNPAQTGACQEWSSTMWGHRRA